MTNTIKAAPQTEIAEAAFDPFVPLTSQSLFWRVHYLKPSAALPALPLVFWLTECLRPRLAVTLGMDDPVPYFALCQAVEKLGLDGMCFGIGLPGAAEGDAGDAGDENQRRDILEYNDAHYAEFSQIFSGPGKDSAELLDDSSVDMLVVNRFADRDLQDEIDQHWLPRMSARAVVLFLGGGDRLGDYIARLSQDRGSFALDAEKRVCIALYGDQHGDRLQRLCQLRLGKSGYLAARNVFLRVGELHSKSVRIEELTREGETGPKAAAEIQALQAQLSEQTELAQRLGDELRDKSAQIASAQSDSFDSKAALEAAQAEHDAKVRALTEDHARAVARLETLEAEIGAHDTAAQKQVEVLERLVEAHKSAAQERTQAYGEELDRLTADLKTATAKASELQGQLDADQITARVKTETLTADLKTANARTAELEQQLEAVQARLDSAETDLKARYDDLAELGTGLEAAEAALAKARKQAEDGAARAEQAEKALEAERKTASERTAELDSARLQVGKAEQTLEHRLGDIEVLGRELALNEAELARARAKIRDLTEALTLGTEGSNDSLSSLRAELDGRQRDMSDLQERLRTAEQERDAARARVSDLEGSTSWRVTAPLRRASLMVRGQPGPPPPSDENK